MRTLTAAALSTLLLAACQTAAPPPRPVATGPSLGGQWASSDGVFVATFADGRFVSRTVATNDVLVQGQYAMQGSQLQLDWYSPRAQRQQTATCTFVSPTQLNCAQPGATGFGLARIA